MGIKAKEQSEMMAMNNAKVFISNMKYFWFCLSSDNQVYLLISEEMRFLFYSYSKLKRLKKSCW